MSDSNKIYLVKTEPIGDELLKYTFPVIFRIMNEDGLSEDITYNASGERSVLKDTNTFTNEEKVKLETYNVSNSTLTMSNNGNISVVSSELNLNNSGSIKNNSSVLDMASGSKIITNNNSSIETDSGYKLSLGLNSAVPSEEQPSSLILAGSANILIENVNNENGSIIVSSGSSTKMEVNDTSFKIGGAVNLEINASSLKITNGENSFVLPTTALDKGVLINNSSGQTTWVTSEEFIEEHLTPDLILTCMSKPGNEALISGLKTLLGIV